MSSHLTHFPQRRLLLLSLLLVLSVAACGRNREDSGDSTQSPSADRLAAPTMPAGQFTAVGEQSILTDTASLTETVQTTQSAQTTQTTQTTAAASPDLSRGEAAYTKNKCGDCHGAKGEGVADKGNAIAGATLSLEEFDAVLRTGGGLGNDHIFGRSAVSPSGMEALYAYVQSLGQ
jgi:mono/diheme cytochrome c family protein